MMTAATMAAIAVSQRRRAEAAHLAPLGGEHHERHDGEGKLKAEDHLATGSASGAVPLSPYEDGDRGCRHDGDAAGDRGAAARAAGGY